MKRHSLPRIQSPRIQFLCCIVCFAALFPPGAGMAEDFLHLESALGRSTDSELVKVRINDVPEQQGARILSSRGFLVTLPETGQALTNIAAANALIIAQGPNLSVGGALLPRAALLLTPVEGVFTVNGISYRGEVIVSRGKGRIALVNRLPVEEYLRGVLPHEVNPNWHLEALKAQAIVARSYVLSRALDNSAQAHDLDNTTASQVYRGTLGEAESTDYAVQATRGLVMTYNGRIAVGFFHSCCGGSTEDSGDVWANTLPYLRAKTCTYCEGTRPYNWGVVFGRAEAAEKLGLGGEVNFIEVRGRSSGGRVRTVYVQSANGAGVTVTGARFRELFDGNRVRSGLFRVNIRGPYVQILGNGWGHGVGMCQWGSWRMAQLGHDAAAIVRHYFTDVRIEPRRVTWQM